jgi:hypothetical protein
MQPNNAIDSDTYSAPLRALISARHCERSGRFLRSREAFSHWPSTTLVGLTADR